MIKLQHLSVIFVIVMIPIIMVLSYYIGIQIDTINLQNQYDTKLNDSTHDAMEAFQINTRNNEFSTVSDSLKRDVAAAVNTFYTSLASNMGVSGTPREELQPYIPAVLCTMYDGYYLSSPTKTQASSENAEDVLKQYTYYTARYKNNVGGKETDVTINYSLDSYISVYGMVNGNYVARAGYLMQFGSKRGLQSITVKGDSKSKEINTIGVEIDGKKYGGDSNGYYIKDGQLWQNGQQQVVNSIQYNGKTIIPEDNIVVLNDNNQYVETSNAKEAIEYYLKAYEFSKYMTGICLADAIDGATVQINNTVIYDPKVTNNKIAKPTSDIFNLKDGEQDKDPENIKSDFVNHKREIIKYCIEDNLQAAFNNFEGVSTYDYQLPKLKDEDWEKIYKNVSFVTFMQGIQVGSKIYNNYSIVTSTGNEEYIDPEEIYFFDNSSSNSGDIYYHRITCPSNGSENLTGYRSNMYQQQSKIITEDTSGNDKTITTNSSGYILKEVQGKNLLAAYDCMVDANYESIYDRNGALAGTISGNKLKSYYTVLARERYILNKRKSGSILNSSSTLKTTVHASGKVVSASEATLTGKLYPSAGFGENKTYEIISVRNKEESDITDDFKRKIEDTPTVFNANKEYKINGLTSNEEYTVTIKAKDKYR